MNTLTPKYLEWEAKLTELPSILTDKIRSSNSKVECPICKEPEASLCQYAIEHKMDSEKFSVIIEAEKKRWAMGCFLADLERDIRLYRGGIKRNEDPRNYYKFLSDRDRLVGEELLCRGIVKSGLSTTWLDDLMEEWEKTYNQFVQIFN
ncbi:hypothetical protein Glove_120g4 [Diversispora epigaea]|uniref:Uncharacterized protein n=1 Tax=Diversispora epigaea TaxID=1348612 RepID=A0A397J8K5_9GLOM|nr:hypothetical protein Glove_120g4 [Diversispora epigaea]